MRALNYIVIEGRIGREPEVRYTSSNTPVVNFSLAVSRGKNNDPDWFKVISYDTKVVDDIQKYFHKGYPIVVNGSLKKNKWTDRSGNEREDVEINAEGIGFYGDGAKRESQAEENADQGFVDVTDAPGELPF